MTRVKFGTRWELEEFSRPHSNFLDLVRYKMLRQLPIGDFSQKEDFEVTTLSAPQLENADSSERVSSQNSDSAPPRHSRDPLQVQITTEGCQWDSCRFHTKKESEVDATLTLQADSAASPRTASQNHSPLLSKAAVADEGSTRVSRDCSQNDEAMLKIPVASVIAEWNSIEWTDATSSSILSGLPTDESVFYEWWEAALSPEQMTLSWLGLTRGYEYDEICTSSSPKVPSRSGDSLDTPSPGSFPEVDQDDQISAPSSPEWLNTSSSPRSVLEFDQEYV